MLAVRDLHAGYGALSILRGVSLTIDAGEAVAIVGANGVGKTTLVRTICGLLGSMSGRIAMDGFDITNLSAHLMSRHGLAVVLENRNLFGELSVQENLAIAERYGRRSADKGFAFTFDEVYELFPVVAERRTQRVELLSGGQQQMVAIARALLLRPRLLIMDEPSTGLAPKVVKDILQITHKLRRRGMSLLLVEQNVGIASEITDRAYVMASGRVVHEVGMGQWETFLSDERLASAYLGVH